MTSKGRPKWTGGFLREPVWPSEPEMSIIKTLASLHLIPHHADLSPSLIKVTFFAEGGFNKFYEIICSGETPAHYIFRIAIGIKPYFKTESEVATFACVGKYTSINVPRVYAWDSCSENELGFEWILMEKLDGVPLMERWREFSWDRKLTLTRRNRKSFTATAGLSIQFQWGFVFQVGRRARYCWIIHNKD